ncbi:MAG: sulfite exporter TauE/SafE family protein [Spirochaetota bacterium]|nr:sulfite exporter TauE/SafE family protein [Spirochaetota bacterium]
MEILTIVEKLIFGAVLGFAIGLTGIGGGVFVLPMLSIFLKLPISVAIGTASFFTFIAKIFATTEHFRRKTINFRVSFLFLLGAVPGNILSSVVINSLVSKYKDKTELIHSLQNNLKIAVIVIMVLSLIVIFIQYFLKISDQKEIKEEKTWGNITKLILFGLIVGIIIGSTSIGGGILIVPILIIFFGITTKNTVGTSIFIGVISTLVTTIIYGGNGQVEFETAGIMWIGSLGGVYFGSLLCHKISEKLLKIIVLGVVLLSTGLMIFGNSMH